MNKLSSTFFSPFSVLSVGQAQTSAVLAGEGGRGVRVMKIQISGAVIEFSSKVSDAL